MATPRFDDSTKPVHACECYQQLPILACLQVVLLITSADVTYRKVVSCDIKCALDRDEKSREQLGYTVIVRLVACVLHNNNKKGNYVRHFYLSGIYSFSYNPNQRSPVREARVCVCRTRREPRQLEQLCRRWLSCRARVRRRLGA